MNRKPFNLNPLAVRTTAEIRDELERRGVCKISRMRVNQLLHKAERKIRAALAGEGRERCR